MPGPDELDPGPGERLAEPLPLDAVEPPAVLTLAERSGRAAALGTAGDDAYRRGRVGVLMVAGGEGTRLGFPGPKGCFPLAPHSGKTIYQLQAEKVVDLSRRLGRVVPLLVLTSPATDAETRAFFEQHARFGLEAEQLRIVVQGTVPSVDLEGRPLLAAPGTPLESPDGHGGALGALAGSGELDRLRADGIAQLLYVQVDNVLAPVDDPEVVGLAVSERAEVVTKVLEKAHPDERVGHLVRLAGRDRVVEYTELSPEQTRALGPDGIPLLRWGAPAMHSFSVEFLARLVESGFRLPLHRSAKPLQAWVDGAVREVRGWKYERFIFDLLPETERSAALEIDRAAEFAPVKNAEGDDSPESAVELMSREYVRWLEEAGVRVDLPPGARVEISPLYAATRAQFLERWDERVTEVTGDYYLEGS